MKIMIVDDHSEMRRVLKNIVRSYAIGQHEIIECKNGEEAVAQYGIHHPDCVLMDFEMDIMNGLDASACIFEQDANANVVIVTGYDTPTLRKKAEKLKVQGFVTKDNLVAITPILQTITQKLL